MGFSIGNSFFRKKGTMLWKSELCKHVENVAVFFYSPICEERLCREKPREARVAHNWVFLAFSTTTPRSQWQCWYNDDDCDDGDGDDDDDDYGDDYDDDDDDVNNSFRTLASLAVPRQHILFKNTLTPLPSAASLPGNGGWSSSSSSSSSPSSSS